MDFYSVLSAYYDELFTLKPATVNFVRSKCVKRGKLLDVGCGTGLLSHALSAKFEQVDGVDLDCEMIRRAASGSSSNEHFDTLNMLELDSEYSAGRFDTITCLGNTVAHLSSIDDITKVLRSFFNLLSDGGIAIIQIVNFDRVIKHGEIALPFLQASTVEFRRTYKFDSTKSKVEFSSSISDKKSGESFDNCVELYPLLKNQLEGLLFSVGFKRVEIFGDYQCNAWNDESGPVIAVAYK